MRYILVVLLMPFFFVLKGQSQTGITQETTIEIVGDTVSGQYVIREVTTLDNGYKKVSIDPENGTYSLDQIKEIAVQRGIQLQRQIALSEARAMRVSDAFNKLNSALNKRGVDYSKEANKRFFRFVQGPWVLFINSADNRYQLQAKGDQNGNLVFRYKNQVFPAVILSERSLVINLPENLGGLVRFYLKDEGDKQVFFSKGANNEYALVKK